MSSGALLLARLSDPERLIPTAEIFEHSEFVDCWNAVDGHVDLVALIKTPAAALPAQLRNLPGIDELFVFDLSDDSAKLVCDLAFSHSFLFIDVASEKLLAVQTQLKALKQVIFCSRIDNRNELVAVVSGDNFQSIDRIVNETIRPSDGVLRVKQDRVINLKQI
jgi:DNA-binding Lrp family transcriptional regulator